MSLIYNATFDSGTRVLSLLDKAGNTISSCEVPSKELVDDPNKPLMLRAIEDNSSVTLRMIGTMSNTYQTSTNGTDWTDYTLGTKISLNNGESVYFRCSNHPTTQTDFDYVYFTMWGKIEAWHNAYSMISSDFSSAEASVGEYGMNGLFEYCQSLTKAPLLLNALGIGCYYGTFIGCTSLTKAPSLPATNLARGCYKVMFGECVSLTQAPELPATTLADNCYERMFSGCRSLKEVRVSATTTATDALKEWLSNVSVTGDFYCDPNATIFPTGTSGIPKNWRRLNINEEAPAVDDITKPLTFKATQDGSTVKLTKIGSPSGDFQTSRDGGNTWTDYTIDTAITLNTGDEVSFRAKANRTSAQTSNDYFYFKMTGKIEAWHNVMSMYRKDDFATYESVVEYAFYYLFKDCTSLTKAPVLPATTLAQFCYSSMFKGCTSLTEAPALPATEFNSIYISLDASNCYDSMFWGCTSLTKAPELPATTLHIRCYYNMFYGCTSLTKAPALPATILEESCYDSMFSGCTSLTKAPELPATTLAFNCYAGMFNYCTSLVNAPALPATTLAQGCYYWMFARCSSLTKAPELTATKLASECYAGMFLGCGRLNEVRCQMPSTISAENVSSYTKSGVSAWLSDVSSTGTFYTNADANWPSGASGIPTGWTRVNA